MVWTMASKLRSGRKLRRVGIRTRHAGHAGLLPTRKYFSMQPPQKRCKHSITTI
jgi:hypothetical protein